MSPEPAPATGRDTTYGDQQENAAAALNQLLVTLADSEWIPLEISDVEQLLSCRAAVLDALTDRLQHVTGTAAVEDPSGPTNAQARQLITTHPAVVLRHVAVSIPHRSTQPLSPLDAMATPSRHPTVEHWREAAAALTIANQSLDQATDQPWLTDPGAAWYLLGDTARALEALIVLDETLEEVGLLADHAARRPAPPPASRTQQEWNTEDRRLATSQIARMASWYATTSEPDLAVAATPGHPAERGPVRVVSKPADLAAGQRQLAEYLRHRHGNTALTGGEQSMDSRTLRIVTRNQIEVCERLATRGAASPGTAWLAAEFIRSADMLRDIYDHSSEVIDHTDRGTNSRALWQQREVSAALSRFGRFELAPLQLHHLLSTTQQVVLNLANATRHEAAREHSNLRLRGRHAAPEARVTRSHPLYKALSAIASAPPPPAAVVEQPRPQPHQRRALGATLDNTPTSAAPSPYARNPYRASPGRDAGPER